MSGKLYINDILVDDDISIPLKYQTNDINDLNNKLSNQSYTAILRKTEYLHEDNPIWESDVYADYIIDGVFLIKKGIVVAEKFTDDEVSLRIVFGAKNLSEILGDTSLTELELGDGEWTWSEITSKTTDDDFCYCLVNPYTVERQDLFFDKGSILDPLSPECFIPFVKVRSILTAIETLKDITFSGDIVNDTALDKMYIPINQNKLDTALNKNGTTLFKGSNDINFKVGASPSDDLLLTWLVTGGVGKYVYGVRFDDNTDFRDDKVYSPRILKDGNYDVEINVDFKFLASITQVNSKVKITGHVLKNWNGLLSGIAGSSILSSEEEFTIEATGYNTYTFNDKLNYYFLATDDIKIVLYIETSAYGSTMWVNGKYVEGSKVSFYSENLSFAGEYKIGQNLPDIKILDFLKSLIQKRGYLLAYDNLNDSFSFDFYKNIKNNFGIDWSDKYVSSEITDIYGIAGQSNYFNYTNDKEMAEDLGSYEYQINKKSLPLNVDLLKDNSSATLMQKHDLIDVETPLLPILGKNTKWEKLKIRFMYVENETISTIYVNDRVAGTPDVESVTSINSAFFTRLGKSKLDYESISNEVYQDFLNMISNYREVDALLNLNESDLDFGINPIYIKQLGGSFMLKEVIFTDRENLSKVKLIRL